MSTPEHQRHVAFLDALAAAVEGRRQDSGLNNDDRAIVLGVLELGAGRLEAEKDAASLKSERDGLRAKLQELESELAARRAFGDNDPEDARLALYRRAWRAWSKGQDPAPFFEEARTNERFFVLPAETIEQTRKRLDSCLDTLALHLGNLRKIATIGQDPKVYRPRLLAKSPYNLKTLEGTTQAFADATRDAQEYIRQAQGGATTESLAKELETLRPVFAEMVRLVSDCMRAQATTARPSLCTQVRLDTLAGLASLPAALAGDLNQLLRHPKGKERLHLVRPLLEETIGVYRAALARCLGRVPEPAKASKTEKDPAAIKRLAKDLLDLDALQNGVIQGQSHSAWEVSDAQKGLIADQHLLQRALQDVESGCNVLAVLDGAPESEFTPLPPSRECSLSSLAEAIRARSRWLDEVARYQVTVAD